MDVKNKPGVEEFLESLREISGKQVEYRWGASGQKNGGVWRCDCRGLIQWALRLLGVRLSCPGTNWMIRRQIAEPLPCGDGSGLKEGMLVFKYRADRAKLPAKYRLGGSAYDSRLGEKDVYHVGVVMSTSPLRILHCSSGKPALRTDTALGSWRLCGRLKEECGLAGEAGDE